MSAVGAELVAARYSSQLTVSAAFVAAMLAVGFLGPAPAFAIPAVSYLASGKQELFEALSEFLSAESRFGDYAQVATRLGTSSSTIAVAVHRLRQRYRQHIREAIRPTLGDPAELDAEMKHLVTVLSV